MAFNSEDSQDVFRSNKRKTDGDSSSSPLAKISRESDEFRPEDMLEVNFENDQDSDQDLTNPEPERKASRRQPRKSKLGTRMAFEHDPLDTEDNNHLLFQGEVTLEEGTGEVNFGEDDGLDPEGPQVSPRVPFQERDQDARHHKDGVIEALHNIVVPQTGVSGNCPVSGCGKWFLHLRTHIVSMHAPKEACPHCGIEIIPRYMNEHVKSEHEGVEVLKYKEVPCPLCNRVVQQYSLRKHFINSHKQSREEAQKLYYSLYPKQNRFKEDPNSPQCPLCQKRVKDMRKHLTKIHKENADDFMKGGKLLPEYDADVSVTGERIQRPEISQPEVRPQPAAVATLLRPVPKQDAPPNLDQTWKELKCPFCSVTVAPLKNGVNLKRHMKGAHNLPTEAVTNLYHLIKADQTELLKAEVDKWVMQNEVDFGEEEEEEVKVEEPEVEEETPPPPEPEMENKARCPVCGNIVGCLYMERHLLILHKVTKAVASDILTGLGIKAKPLLPPSVTITRVSANNPAKDLNQSKSESAAVAAATPVVQKVRCNVCNNVVASNFLAKHLKILHRMSEEQIQSTVERIMSE